MVVTTEVILSIVEVIMEKWEYIVYYRIRKISTDIGGLSLRKWLGHFSEIAKDKYSIINPSGLLEEVLQELGKDGWELVSVISASDGGSFNPTDYSGLTTSEKWVFKRQLE